jgi:hypothetical protein
MSNFYNRKKEDARNTRFRKLGNKHAPASSRESSSVRIRIGVFHDAPLVRVCLEGAVGRIDESTRLNRVHGGAAGVGVQRGLRVVHHVDAFKCVNFAACGPVWGLRPEGGPDGALDVQREVPASGFSTCVIKNVDVPEVVKN